MLNEEGGGRHEDGQVLEEQRRVEDEDEQRSRRTRSTARGPGRGPAGSDGARRARPTPPRGCDRGGRTNSASTRSWPRTEARTKATLRDRSTPLADEEVEADVLVQTAEIPTGAPARHDVATGPRPRPTARCPPRRRHTSHTHARAAGPANRLFTARARPRSSAVAIVRRREGSPLATSTEADTALAAVTPSDSIRLVVNSTRPLVATSSAASAAPHRSATRRPEPVDHDDEQDTGRERQAGAAPPERAEPQPRPRSTAGAGRQAPGRRRRRGTDALRPGAPPPTRGRRRRRSSGASGSGRPGAGAARPPRRWPAAPAWRRGAAAGHAAGRAGPPTPNGWGTRARSPGRRSRGRRRRAPGSRW